MIELLLSVVISLVDSVAAFQRKRSSRLLMKYLSAIFILLLIGCFVPFGKIGDAVAGESIKRMPIEIGSNFKILLDGKEVSVIGFDACLDYVSLCIVVYPETKLVRVKIMLSPEVVETWEVTHINGNDRISFHRPNGETIISAIRIGR